MNGVADMEKLQSRECRREGGKECDVHEPTRPTTSFGPRSG